MFLTIKVRRKLLLIIYSILGFLTIIAFISRDFIEENNCVNLLIYNEIKLKTFVTNDSRLSTNPKWSPIINQRISIYSAFLFKDSEVRITSLVDQDLWSQKRSRIQCHFHRFINSSIKFSSLASLRVLNENKFGDRRYAASEIKCPLPRQYHSIMSYVKLSVGNDSLFQPSIPVLKAKTYHMNDSSLETVVCIRPVFDSEHMMSSIVEFLAYYRANKISKFIFYDLHIDKKLKAFLTNLDFVEILPWKLSIYEYSIHALGQRAAMHDCLLRFSNSPIIFVDIDEFIVIQEKKTSIQSIIEEKMRDKRISSLVINNRFLCHEFQSHHNFPLILSHNRIQTYYWRSGDRSKIIVLRPDTVIDTLIHRVTITKPNYYSQELDDSQVLLYHYRSCCGLNQEFVHLEHLNLYFKAVKDKHIEDYRIKWFETEIYSFVNKYVIDYTLTVNPQMKTAFDIQLIT